MEECCNRMEREIEDGNIEKLWAGTYWVHVRPSFATDGYWNNSEERIEIYYCPFCGKKLNSSASEIITEKQSPE